MPAASENDPWDALEQLEAEDGLDGSTGASDPWAQLEAEADQLLGGLPDDPDSVKPLLTKLRKQLSGRARAEREAEQRGYERGRQETTAAIQREALFAQHAVPARLRSAFADIAPGDADAFAQRVSELAADGIVWRRPDGASPAGEPAQPGQPTAPEAPPPVDPGAAVRVFQQAQAAGIPADRDVLSRVAQGGIGAVKDASDAAGFEAQLNKQIGALGLQARAGIQG